MTTQFSVNLPRLTPATAVKGKVYESAANNGMGFKLIRKHNNGTCAVKFYDGGKVGKHTYTKVNYSVFYSEPVE